MPRVQRVRPKSLMLPAKAENLSARRTRSNQSKNRWILLVEDDDDLRSATGKMLAKEGGLSVTGVSDARSAILVCRGIVRPDFSSSRSRYKFDPNFSRHHTDSLDKNATDDYTQINRPACLVLDIRLTGSMDGLDLLKIIRSDPSLESLPVVLLTAKGKVEDRIRGYEAGADAYLPKPFEPEELISIVNGLLKRDTLSISGDVGETTAQDKDRDEVYGDLKRELVQIKALIHQLDKPPSTPEIGDSTPGNSIHKDILDIKEVIKGNIEQMEANSLPSQSTTKIHETFSLTVLTPGG